MESRYYAADVKHYAAHLEDALNEFAQRDDVRRIRDWRTLEAENATKWILVVEYVPAREE